MIFIFLSVTVGHRFGQAAKTLHVARRSAGDSLQSGFYSFEVPKEVIENPSDVLERHARSVNNSTAPKIASVVSYLILLFCSN